LSITNAQLIDLNIETKDESVYIEFVPMLKNDIFVVYFCHHPGIVL